MTRLVIKLGSSSIARGDGLALDVIAGLVTQIAAARRDGHEVLLVTSGAARLGRRLLAFEGPAAGAGEALRGLVGAVRSSLAAEQADGSLQATLDRYDGSAELPGALAVALPAAVGQPALMALYRQLAAAVGLEVGQVLVSKSDLDSPRAMADLGRLLHTAAGRGLLPIVNGNDTADPLSALDNDQVAIAVAVAAQAQRLLFLTDVRAAYRDPALRDRIARLTPDEARSVRVSALGTGRGGMRSKLHAAARAAYCGIECVIGSAAEPDVVARSLNPRSRMGTVVRAAGRQLDEPSRWIGGVAYSEGTVAVNREAEASLRGGSTLFLSGIKRVDGRFGPGAVVELVDVRHPERLIGRGRVALAAALLRLLRALSPDDVANVISVLFRIRHSLGEEAPGARQRAAVRAEILCPEKYADCAELAAGGSTAAARAWQQVQTFSAETVIELTDSLLLAQPKVCAAVLLDGGFRAGRTWAETGARRASRDIHAIHRDSVVSYAEG